MNLTEKLNAKGKEGVLGAIRDVGVYEYGIEPEELAEKIEKVCAEHLPADGPMLAACGLNNNDCSQMLLEIVREDPGKVLEGLQAVGWLVDAQGYYFYLPEGEEPLAETVSEKAAELGLSVEVVCDIADERKLRDGITCHVETLAAVADVLEGTYEPGTLVSVVKYETSDTVKEVKTPEKVPFGTKLAEVTGSLEGIKAVGVGAALYLPAQAKELVIEAKLALGDGVIKLYGDGCCMVDVAERALLADRKRSCGKCTFCREGLLQLYIRTHETTTGKGSLTGLGIMKDIGEAMKTSCCCTVGEYGAALTLETMRLFGNEYEDHISRKKCTVGTCLAFVNVYIDPDKCTGCGECLESCADGLIEGLPGYIHMIESLDCTKCGECQKACKEGAVVRTLGLVPRLPDRLTRVGRFKRY